jgi:hypothetical protein
MIVLESRFKTCYKHKAAFLLWTRCAVDTLRQYEISSQNDTTKGHVSGYIIEWNYPTHSWAWIWSVLLVRAFRYTGNKNEWIVWWCGWICTARITLLEGFLDSLAYTDGTYGFALFCVIEWFTFVYISVFFQLGRSDISGGVVIRLSAGRPRNRSYISGRVKSLSLSPKPSKSAPFLQNLNWLLGPPILLSIGNRNWTAGAWRCLVSRLRIRGGSLYFLSTLPFGVHK